MFTLEIAGSMLTCQNDSLPLDTVMLLISELLPKVQELQTSRKANSTAAVVDFLSTVTLKHVLLATPPIIPRSFVASLTMFCTRHLLTVDI